MMTIDNGVLVIARPGRLVVIGAVTQADRFAALIGVYPWYVAAALVAGLISVGGNNVRR